jgi:hypothetical protein
MSKESHHKPEERDPDNEIVPRRIFFIAIGKIPEKYMINIGNVVRKKSGKPFKNTQHTHRIEFRL